MKPSPASQLPILRILAPFVLGILLAWRVPSWWWVAVMAGAGVAGYAALWLVSRSPQARYAARVWFTLPIILMGIALGAEDYTANLKTPRTPEGSELLLARETIVVAARAAGIACFDTVYSNLDDMETFRKEVELIKNLGFDGKSIINPRQIEIVNDVFTPKQKDIDKALAVVAAIKEAEKKGSGVIAVNGKMVDRPVVIRAQHTIELAIASGVLKQEDIDNE